MGPLGWWCVAFWVATAVCLVTYFANKKCIDAASKGKEDSVKAILSQCKAFAYTYGPASLVQCVACIAIIVVFIMGRR